MMWKRRALQLGLLAGALSCALFLIAEQNSDRDPPIIRWQIDVQDLSPPPIPLPCVALTWSADGVAWSPLLYEDSKSCAARPATPAAAGNGRIEGASPLHIRAAHGWVFAPSPDGLLVAGKVLKVWAQDQRSPVRSLSFWLRPEPPGRYPPGEGPRVSSYVLEIQSEDAAGNRAGYLLEVLRQAEGDTAPPARPLRPPSPPR